MTYHLENTSNFYTIANMKIITPKQTRQLDQYTIEQEPISSLALMERAAQSFCLWFEKTFPQGYYPLVQIICGVGNNGGDGLAIARLLYRKFYRVEIFFCKISETLSSDCQANFERLPIRNAIPLQNITKNDPFPHFAENAIVIDAILGSGLNRPVEGYWAMFFQSINQSKNTIVSIDIPSGLFAQQATDSQTINADYTYTFQLPKLAFLFPKNQDIIGQWTIGNIGLSTDFLESIEVNNYYLTPKMVQSLLQKRSKFDHKGTYGHALLVAGSYGKMGAAILAAKASMRAGAGLLSVQVPSCGYQIMQISFPEAMVIIDRHKHYFSRPTKLDKYKAIGIGPGLGTEKITMDAMEELLHKAKAPLVIDADALNILAKKPKFLKCLPKESILTPHPKEFERLFGKTEDDFERNALQRQKAEELNCIIILKGANTCIATPDGNCYFNSTGNPGMGTAGTGDVLTGILTGLRAQGYSAKDTAILGVYLHGLAGDIAAKDVEQESLIANDLITYLGKGFKAIRECLNN